jgi:probable addiction module antidote protein
MTLQLSTFDLTDHLDSEGAVAEYLSQEMADGDDDELLRALAHVAKARGMSQLAKEAGVGRESLYKALKPGATPGFATVGKVVRALGLRMAVRPAAKQKPAAVAWKIAKRPAKITKATTKVTKKPATGEKASIGARGSKAGRARA